MFHCLCVRVLILYFIRGFGTGSCSNCSLDLHSYICIVMRMAIYVDVYSLCLLPLTFLCVCTFSCLSLPLLFISLYVYIAFLICVRWKNKINHSVKLISLKLLSVSEVKGGSVALVPSTVELMQKKVVQEICPFVIWEIDCFIKICFIF